MFGESLHGLIVIIVISFYRSSKRGEGVFQTFTKRDILSVTLYMAINLMDV